jgi:cobalt-zinc-cadmium efflux system membrane fusion protein
MMGIATALMALTLPACTKPVPPANEGRAQIETKMEDHAREADRFVKLTPEARKAAGIAVEAVTERNEAGRISVTGSVEANLEKMQQATTLVTGRVDSLNVRVGDRVKEGDVLAIVSSPQIAELRGKIRESETRLRQARENYERVQRAESRVALLQAKARLDETDATLKRTRRLIELGAAAGKDLTAAEAAYASAKADYDYQSNISLNREIQQARADVETAEVEMSHLRVTLGALGASVLESSSVSPFIPITAPLGGTVIERMVNAGAGVEVGKPLFTIADTSTLWVIANVPDGQINTLRVGTSVDIRLPDVEARVIRGRVAYVEPTLNEETRTGRVRIEIANADERLKVGMFVTVDFRIPSSSSSSTLKTLTVPEAAVQRVGGNTIVFVADATESSYEAREVQLGGLVNGYFVVTDGLQAGERVVNKGSFTLKTQLLKGELGEGHD